LGKPVLQTSEGTKRGESLEGRLPVELSWKGSEKGKKRIVKLFQLKETPAWNTGGEALQPLQSEKKGAEEVGDIRIIGVEPCNNNVLARREKSGWFTVRVCDDLSGEGKR